MTKDREFIGCNDMIKVCIGYFHETFRMNWWCRYVSGLHIVVLSSVTAEMIRPYAAQLCFGWGRGKKKSEYASTADSGPAIRHC